MAEKSTTTPALITHVITVGLTGVVDSATLTRRPFLDEPLRSFGEIDLRLALAIGGPGVATGDRVCLLRGGHTNGLVSVSRVEEPSSSPLSSPIATDSPTSRKAAGCVGAGADGADGIGWASDFGRPRAAAAHERRVDRLARSAAS